MGIFDWLTGSPKNVAVQEDVIWLTKREKQAGIFAAASRILTARDKPAALLLVGHFPNCVGELQQAASAGGGFDSGSVLVVLAKELKDSAALASGFDQTAAVEMIVAERHPNSANDAAIVEFARSLPCRCRLTFHVSLEDAVMRAFAGEWVQAVLKQLGMKEGEAIESNMVARRIKAAQQKIASVSVGDLAAESAERWMELNCPEIWRQVSN